MKYVNTNDRVDEKIDFDMLHNLVCYTIYEEQFIVLTDDHTQNFIQMAEIGQKFIVEYRQYSVVNNLLSYQHYRTFVDEPEQAYVYFTQFYTDTLLVEHEVWQDVSEEFREIEL